MLHVNKRIYISQVKVVSGIMQLIHVHGSTEGPLFPRREFPNNFPWPVPKSQMFFPVACNRDTGRDGMGKKISREKQSRLLACTPPSELEETFDRLSVCVPRIHVYVGRISSFLGNHGQEVVRKIISPKTGYTQTRYMPWNVVANGYSATPRCSIVEQVPRARKRKTRTPMEFRVGPIESGI